MKKRDAKSSPPTNLTPDETALFRGAVQDVAPLAVPDKITHPRKQPRPVPRQTRSDQHTPLDDSLSDHIPLEAEGEDSTSFLRSGLSRQSLRRLRRGYWPLERRLRRYDASPFVDAEDRSRIGRKHKFPARSVECA